LRTIIYIDGFNLYYRALRGTPYKWLNLQALCIDLLDPSNNIEQIKYFTARVSGRQDPDEPKRQHAYLRALDSLPRLEIFYGNFITKTPMNRSASTPICARWIPCQGWKSSTEIS
jgi:hypothetical protein